MIELALIVKATVVLGVAVTAAWIARRQRAAVRYLLLASGFAVLLLLPLAAAVSPRFVVEIPFAAAVSVPVAAPAGPMTGAGVDRAMAPAASARPDAPAGGRERIDAVALSWRQVLRVAWALGVLLGLAPMVTALGRVRDLRRHGRVWPGGEVLARQVAAAVGVRRQVSVLLHEDVAVPMACGLVRPAILLPPDAPDWTAADLRHALLHELEHVRRADWPAFVAARLACAIWWFHPLAWTAWRRLCLEAERACDDAVLGSADRRAYAAQLVRMADRLVVRRPAPAPAMAARSVLSSRVKAVLDAGQPRGRAGVWWASGLAAAVVLALTALGPLRVIAAQDPPGIPTGERFETVTLRRGAFPFGQATFDVVPGSPVGYIHGPYTLGFAASGASVETLIRWGYGIGFPQALPRATFRVPDTDWRRPPRPFVVPPAGELGEVHEMVRTLLADRFGLAAHWETRETVSYEITLAGEPGARLRPLPDPPQQCFQGRPWERDGEDPNFMLCGDIARLATMLTRLLERPVVDRTGLEGRVQIHATVGSEITGGVPLPFYGRRPAEPRRPGPTLTDVLRDRLGLELVSRPATEDVLVIDRIERPVLDP